MLKGINLHFLKSEKGTQTIDIQFSNDNIYSEDMIIAIGALVSKLAEQTGTPKDKIIKEVKSLLINNKHAVTAK